MELCAIIRPLTKFPDRLSAYPPIRLFSYPPIRLSAYPPILFNSMYGKDYCEAYMKRTEGQTDGGKDRQTRHSLLIYIHPAMRTSHQVRSAVPAE